MKKILIIASLALCCSLLASCEDFLDTKKYGAKTDWETQEDVEKALVALFSFNTNDAEGVTGRGITWFECCSDDMTVGRPQGEAEDIRNFRMSPSNGRDVKNNWKIMYEVNAKANNIIKVVPTMNLDNAFKTKATGTAYFFRGFAMLWLSPYYGDNGPNGGIPIILDTTPAAEIDSPRPAHVLQNYDQIISDMRTAGEMLPYLSQLDASQIGLPHKAAAWGYAARAALYAAQYDAKYYDIVLEMCNKIMALTGSDKRELYIDPSNKLNSYANLWRKEQNHSKEYIFSLEGDYTNGARYHGVTFVNAGWGLYNTWGYFTPSKNLWDAFEEGDQRRDVTILYPGQHVKFVGRDITFGGYNTDGSVSDYTTGHVSAGLICRKFISPWEGADCKGKEVSALRDKLWNSLNCCLLRYADVMLMKAEALIWTKGEGDAEAKQLLNQIRDRAGLPQNSQATKAQLMNERRCELAFEFQPSRHIDVVRWGIATTTYAKPLYSVISKKVNGQIVAEEVEVYPGRTFNPTYNKVFPIPQRAFTGTVYLKQNKGY